MHIESLPDEALQGKAITCAALCMFFATADRTIFAVSGKAISLDLHLTVEQLGILHSAFLLGSAVMPIVGGSVADRYGGPRVLIAALASWSFATLVVALIPMSCTQFWLLCLLRFWFGCSEGICPPAALSTVSSSVPPKQRGQALAKVFFCFHSGSAMGLLLGGAMLAVAPWWLPFIAFGTSGLVLARSLKKQLPKFVSPLVPRNGAVHGISTLLRTSFAFQVLAMIYCHSAYNWGFFFLQGWLPLYLNRELGIEAFAGAGAALPWMVCAMSAFHAGRSADVLLRRGWPVLRVRRLFFSISMLGPSLALWLLRSSTTLYTALPLIAVALGAQAVIIAGFHGYVGDVAPSHSGQILGITNTCGLLLSSFGHRHVGRIVDEGGGFDSILQFTAAIYASAVLVFFVCLRGRTCFPAD